jgi:hypothetical protein
MANINKGIFNDYSIKPKNLTQYTSFRGVTDFSQIGKFNQYETGYQFLSVIQLPPFMVALGEQDSTIKQMNQTFKDMLEYEFRGMDGLQDVQADTFEITDGINSVNMINKVTEDTSITISMPYFEKMGGLIAKYSEYYLTGIKDLKSQAKTYHGLIKNGLMEPSLENEVFTLMYYATDNTMLRLEKAVLLANCQLTRAENSMYNGNRSDINNHEVNIEFNAFPIRGVLVDKAAKALLEDITGVTVSNPNSMVGNTRVNPNITNAAVLDSTSYRYGIMRNEAGAGIEALYSKMGAGDENTDPTMN